MLQLQDTRGVRLVPAWSAVADLDIAGVTADSRAVVPGDLFAALPGSRVDGRIFIADAVRRGAVAILAPVGTDWPEGVPRRPVIADPEPRRALALIAAMLAGPQPRTVVAITGTNGKTSSAEFTRQLWASDGTAAASLGTLGVIAPGFPPGPGLTTPDPVTLAETMAGLRRVGVSHAAIEASSHGLDQFRLDGVPPGSGCVHQPDTRSSGLPWRYAGISPGEAALVPGSAAHGRARRGPRRHGSRDIGGDPGDRGGPQA